MITLASGVPAGSRPGARPPAAAMPFDRIVPLDRLTPADAARAGGKAHNCARLKQAGFLVPDGLVVLSTAAPLEVMAIAVHPWFDSMPAGTRFAVRSSIAREYGLPAIANLRQATRRLRTGDRVRLDADHGLVQRQFVQGQPAARAPRQERTER